MIDPSEEADLARRLAELPFEPFDVHGHLANRHVVGFGRRYDYASRQVRTAPATPDWLNSLREKVGAFSDQTAESFVQVLINQGRTGAGIGWHKDKPHFEEVVGVSLLSPCSFRLRRKRRGLGTQSLTAEPRSACLMSGPSRHQWEHSIPSGDAPLVSETESERIALVECFSASSRCRAPTS